MRILNVFLVAALAVCTLPARAEPANACLAAFEQAAAEQELITGSATERGVVGTGRLYLHTAPDTRCRLKDVFVITGDRVEAFSSFGEFTSVIYWDPTTGAGTAGWVLSSRVPGARTNLASNPALR